MMTDPTFPDIDPSQGLAGFLPPEALRLGVEVSDSLVARGNPLDALKMRAAMVLASPRDRVALAALCESLLSFNLGEEALRCASAMTALNPADPTGYIMSARACILIGAIAEAREDIATALTLAERTGSGPDRLEALHLQHSLDATLSDGAR